IILALHLEYDEDTFRRMKSRQVDQSDAPPDELLLSY
ncbi:hypothetical protein THAOC_10875, partial [Thalassiosira oceanica]